MERLTVEPLGEEFIKKLDESGFTFHDVDEYWNHKAAYKFTLKEIEQIESDTQELHHLALETVSHIISRGDYEGYHLPDKMIRRIEADWRDQVPYLYGRFDLLPGDNGRYKLIEYNADTPTCLHEPSVAQWHWLELYAKKNGFDGELSGSGIFDQYNFIHEQLIAQWTELRKNQNFPIAEPHIHFTAMSGEAADDWVTTLYLMDTSIQAGFDATSIEIEKIKWDGVNFRGENHERITHLFKLYPWEFLMNDEFFDYAEELCFIEPAWKLLISHKQFLIEAWRRNMHHPCLLEAQEGELESLYPNFIKKPKLGREGWNVTGSPLFNAVYDKSGYVIQERAPVLKYVANYGSRDNGTPASGVRYPIIGSWVVGDTACGMGIREDHKATTTISAQFVPHFFVG